MRRPVNRNDFPGCAACTYLNPGHWSICFPCAREQLATISDPCPICAQERSNEGCRNKLCTGEAGSRYIDRIEAVTLHEDHFADVLRRYKYGKKTGWATIFARLLVGYLEYAWSTRNVDLIVANPPSPSRDHVTRVVEDATLADLDRRWPFDAPHDPAIVKGADTTQSAGQPYRGKQQAAIEHGEALQLRHPARIYGKRILVYDDVCTTGLQLNAVARRLRGWGAISVHGVVLARQPWR